MFPELHVGKRLYNTQLDLDATVTGVYLWNKVFKSGLLVTSFETMQFAQYCTRWLFSWETQWRTEFPSLDSVARCSIGYVYHAHIGENPI